MKKHLLFTIIALTILICSTSMSAEQFVQGRVYTIKGDTITGWIALQTNTELSKGCMFRTALKEATRKYEIEDLSGFQIRVDNRNFGKYRVNHLNRDKDVFLETLVSGKLNLLYWCDKMTGDVFYLLQAGGSTVIDLPFQQSERYVDNGYARHMMLVSTTMHHDTLQKYMADRPDLYKDIAAINMPKMGNLTKLVSKYNNANAYSSMGQKKDVEKSTRINRQFFMCITPGVTYSEYQPTSYSTVDYYAGATLSFGLETTKNQVLINTGFYKRFNNNTDFQLVFLNYPDFHPIYKVPLDIEFRFTNYWIQPLFAIGITKFLDSEKSSTLLAPSVGLNVKLLKRVSINYRFTVDIVKVDFMNQSRIERFNSSTAGIQFRF